MEIITDKQLISWIGNCPIMTFQILHGWMYDSYSMNHGCMKFQMRSRSKFELVSGSKRDFWIWIKIGISKVDQIWNFASGSKLDFRKWIKIWIWHVIWIKSAFSEGNRLFDFRNLWSRDKLWSTFKYFLSAIRFISKRYRMD